MHPTTAILPLFLILAGAFVSTTSGAEATPRAAETAKEGIEFFEKHIRPVLVERCYECHSTQARKVKGKLLLDSGPGIARGGENGPAIVPGDVEMSPLIQAIRWTDPTFVMPPKERLTPQQVEKFEQWVKMGAPDPRARPASPSTGSARNVDLRAGRTWWAFQPVTESPAPALKQPTWARTRIDAFVLQALESQQLTPSPPADPRTLIQRAYLDLTGLRPTYEQTEAFVNDPSDTAYARVVEQLLASPHYGERWGRHWLDVARYGEDNPIGGATNPPYLFAWRYRDWVIQALNHDVPYDRFVTLQLAADLIPAAPRSDLAATGFLGAGPTEHKDGRLSKDVIENFYMEDWDERVDVVSRGVLGLTVACARCHDHKFDPITSRDYYALAGVFASTVAVPRPTADVDPQVETRFMAAAHRLFYLSYVANLLRNEPGSKPRESRQKVEQFTAELDRIENEIAFLREPYPDLHAHLTRLARRPAPYEPRQGARRDPLAANQPESRGGGSPRDPFMNSVFDAGLWVDGSDPELTMPVVKPGESHDLRVLPGGNVAKPGETASLGFLSVLAKGDAAFHHGSGRLELAEKIFTDVAPLAARVIVNRVRAWHFGRPLVDTPSDFGTQGERPSHPQLLDDLAARFIASGWSLKWLHRELMLSASYRQASRPRADALRVDPANRLLWRMNPRLLDIEAYRDCILQASGRLDPGFGGPSTDIDRGTSDRRTVYARVSRSRLSNLLQLYGFPEAAMHSPSRETATTPFQQLFVMNSPFMRDQAAALLGSVSAEPDVNARLRAMHRKVLGRDPSAHELALAGEYLTTSTMEDYAHALLCLNEVIFWP